MVPLADFTPLSPQAQAAIFSVIAIVLAILAIRGYLRRSPPLDSELVKLNTAIASLQTSVEELSKTQKSHATHAIEIDALQEKVRRLESNREEDMRAQRTYTRETTREIFEKLERVATGFAEKVDKVSASFASNVQKLEGALGRLDGTCEQLSKRLDRLEN